MTYPYVISAINSQGAYCSGGKANSLSAAIKQARNTFSAGWKISIYVADECVKSWITRK